MLPSWIRTVIVLVLLVVAFPSSAYVLPPTLIPPAPRAEDVVGFEIPYGECDLFYGSETPIPVTQSGMTIKAVVPSIHQTNIAFCLFGNGVARYQTRAFPPGAYTFQIDRTYTGFLGNQIVETIAAIPFTVTGSPPQEVPIPALGAPALALLTLGLFLLSRKRLAPFLCLALLLTGQDASAQTYAPNVVQLLVRADVGDPSSDDVLNYLNSSPRSPKPPIANLDVGNPTGARYLLQQRAEGDFLDYLNANPQSSRAKLERYLIVEYPTGTNLTTVISTLSAEPQVLHISKPLPIRFSSAVLIGYGFGGEPPLTLATPDQYARVQLNIDSAWARAGGYALVGLADNGLATTHPSLRQFSATGQYLGGNFIPVASYDIGSRPVADDANVDEAEPSVTFGGNGCPHDGNGHAVASYAGHGTHVAGLVAANSDGQIKGTCKNCGLAMFRVSRYVCAAPPVTDVFPDVNSEQIPAALTYLTDLGVQVLNQSFGFQAPYTDLCYSAPQEAFCVALAHAASKQVMMVAASGNWRQEIDFPASDSRVVAAGGIQESHTLWDESPGTLTNCPQVGSNSECGSNYAKAPDPSNERADQELVAGSARIWSLTYPNMTWNPIIKCGDNYPGPGYAGGQGLCTGTSMSSPEISGVSGILRSVNPLVAPSTPTVVSGQGGIRTVLAQNTYQALAGIPKSNQLGFGYPNTEAAVKRMLGKVAGAAIKNRVTPLFRMKSTGASDYADTTSPQFALALRYAVASYTSDGPTVPGYSAFPYEAGTTPPPIPKAAAYVLTTEYTPRASYPPLRPLYMMSKGRVWPSGCNPDVPPCVVNAADYTLMATVSDVEQAHAGGYELRTIQGYVYSPCSPEPSCIPPGAQKLWRACKTAASDCAVFLESERSTFEANGYTSAYPAASSKLLGYAYGSTDSDGDGLVDGFEHVVGTNPLMSDSDGIGFGDAMAFPMVGLQVSDPCLGAGSVNCPGEKIFANGFQ
ncbi:subtilase family protein [Tahibacter aquaticus]|uniref:Subtilase family protein n=2 Tax=Tahibacter aquaticus TaxID=520092 RepID=A0A4R6YJW1_9GAMM|nr:subtilase family protein [Tahibacter aquaticus]